MKKKMNLDKWARLSAIALLLTTLHGCVDTSLFDIKGVDISLNGKWRIPAMYGTFSIDSLLKQSITTDDNILVVLPDGTTAVEYAMLDIYKTGFNQYVSVGNRPYVVQKSVVLPAQTIPAGNTALLVQESGAEPIIMTNMESCKQLDGKTDIRLKVSPSPVPLIMYLKLPTLKVAGKVYEKVVEIPANRAVDAIIDHLNDFTALTNPVDGKLSYEIRVENKPAAGAVTIAGGVNVNIEFSMQTVFASYLEGVVSPLNLDDMQTDKQELPLNILKDLDGKVMIKDVSLELTLKSKGLMIPIELSPNVKAFGAKKDLTLTPVTYSILLNSLTAPTADKVVIGNNTNISELISLMPVNGYQVGASISANKNKELCKMKNDGYIAVDVKITAPLHLKIKGFEMTDTVPFSLDLNQSEKGDASPKINLKIKEGAGLVIVAENNLPLTLAVNSLQMLDADNNSIGGSIKITGGKIAGCKTDAQGFSLGNGEKSSIEIMLSDEQIKMLNKCKAFAFSLTFSDSGEGENYVKIRGKDSLKIGVVAAVN